MKYAIIESGQTGTALAGKEIEVAIANSRGHKTNASLKEELGPSLVPQSIQDAGTLSSSSFRPGQSDS
jgi:predicted dinucleotide-binding enzyme